MDDDSNQKTLFHMALGGLHISFNPEKEAVHADCIVVGEADNLWTMLLDNVANKRLKKRYDADDFPPVKSIKQSTLGHYNKGHVNSAKKYTKIIEDYRRTGLNIQGNVLFNPSIDTIEDIDELVGFVEKNRMFMPIFQIITPYPSTRIYHEYKESGLMTDEDWEKYNALHLVIKSDRYAPLLFQYKVLSSYVKIYSWRHILNGLKPSKVHASV